MDKKGLELSKTFWIVLIGICLLFIILIAIGFIAFSHRKEEVIENEENGGKITLNYTNNITGLSLKDIIPTTDSVAIKELKDGKYFDFFIDIDLKKASSIEYEISAIKDDDPKNSSISDDDIRIYLEKEKSGTYTKVFGPSKYIPIKKTTELGSPAGSMVLVHSKAIQSSKDNYRLRMWLSDKSVMEKGNYSVDIVVNGHAK